MIGLRFNARSHVGRVRKLNEDSILAMGDARIFVVSDGMGGHEGGDWASRMVVDSVALLSPTLEPAEKLSGLRRALQEANAAIHAEALRRGAVMGATVVALVFSEAHFLALWAGDSRLYRLRGGQVELLTSDHSLVAAFVEAGQMTWDEAGKHPQSNAITRAVGVGEELELDKIRGEVAKGDRFLLCSDGLSKYMGVSEIGNALRAAPLEMVTDGLIQVALDRGGADNVSVIVIDLV